MATTCSSFLLLPHTYVPTVYVCTAVVACYFVVGIVVSSHVAKLQDELFYFIVENFSANFPFMYGKLNTYMCRTEHKEISLNHGHLACPLVSTSTAFLSSADGCKGEWKEKIENNQEDGKTPSELKCIDHFAALLGWFDGIDSVHVNRGDFFGKFCHLFYGVRFR